MALILASASPRRLELLKHVAALVITCWIIFGLKLAACAEPRSTVAVSPSSADKTVADIQGQISGIATRYPFQVHGGTGDEKYCTEFLNDLKAGNFEAIKPVVEENESYSQFIKKNTSYLGGCQLPLQDKNRVNEGYEQAFKPSNEIYFQGNKEFKAYLITLDEGNPDTKRILFSSGDLTITDGPLEQDVGLSYCGYPSDQHSGCTLYKMLDAKACRYDWVSMSSAGYFSSIWVNSFPGIVYIQQGPEVERGVNGLIKYKDAIVLIGTNDTTYPESYKKKKYRHLDAISIVKNPHYAERRRSSPYQWETKCAFSAELSGDTTQKAGNK